MSISYGCVILTSGLETDNYSNTYRISVKRKHKTAPVHIGEGVWLGANCLVMPGVKIANSIIVGAGSVVTKDLEKPGWLYAGVPAKPVKPLNKEKV